MTVVYSPRSVRDLVAIRKFIASESHDLSLADHFVRHLADSCDALSLFPDRYPSYRYSRKWRMKPEGNYLIFFQQIGDEIRIAHIRHGARRPLR